MDGFATRACACKDVACLDGVEAAMKKWADDTYSKTTDPRSPTDAQADKLEDASGRFAQCSIKLRGDTGADDPPPPE